MKIKLITCVSMLWMGCSSAFASEVQYDKSVAEAAAKKAAEKIGELRPSIDYDQVPGITQPEDIKAKRASEYELPEVDSQRITQADQFEKSSVETHIDYTMTGSVDATPKTPEIRVVWQKFDTDGNLIQ